jgi:hypothetical protein
MKGRINEIYHEVWICSQNGRSLTIESDVGTGSARVPEKGETATGLESHITELMRKRCMSEEENRERAMESWCGELLKRKY